MSRRQHDLSAGLRLARDANLASAAAWLGCRMASAPAELQRNLAAGPRTAISVLMARRAAIETLRAPSTAHVVTELPALFEEAATLEADLAPFFEAPSKEKEDLEEDAMSQLSFQGEYTKSLNTIPFLVTALALYKIWIVPTMTVATPIFAWILPYLLMRFVWSLPITQNEYMAIMRQLWAGDMSTNPFESLRNSIQGGSGGWSELLTPKSIAQGAFFLFSFAQSLIQPIQNALHLHTTDKIFLGVGQKLLRLRTIIQNLRRHLATVEERTQRPHLFGGLPRSFLADLEHADARIAFFLVKDQPERLRLALADVARLEILFRMSQKDVLRRVRFTPSVLELRDAVDISVGDAAVASSVELMLGAKPHAVITGPNGGGKSSFLRAVLQSVLFGHAYGVAPAAAAQMPRFAWIASGLQLRDAPGKFSMFETEVRFAADTLATAARYERGPAGPRGLVLFDELFHSTNPPDGARSAQRFLHNLWAQPSLFSIVSTHVFPLVEGAPDNVQPICTTATVRSDGEIDYTFRVEPGICRVSSVRKVWERFGLGPTGSVARPPATGQTLPAKEKE